MGRKYKSGLINTGIYPIKHNPIIKDFSQRLSNVGKSKMVIVIAAIANAERFLP
ncbi:hypothetical protein [Rickettsia endosymbiont of Urophora cardui]|uniref:hypothetical protein n=1 Tax=Rickettsia endosymbiont of Urophora cardui TaxID=3066265 RepID=UPI00313C3F91